MSEPAVLEVTVNGRARRLAHGELDLARNVGDRARQRRGLAGAVRRAAQIEGEGAHRVLRPVPRHRGVQPDVRSRLRVEQELPAGGSALEGGEVEVRNPRGVLHLERDAERHAVARVTLDAQHGGHAAVRGLGPTVGQRTDVLRSAAHAPGPRAPGRHRQGGGRREGERDQDESDHRAPRASVGVAGRAQ